MSLSEISIIASIVSSLAVAASLVYLALRTHQNAKHTRALVVSATGDRRVTMNLEMADENLCRADIIENGGEATPEAIRQRQSRLVHTAIRQLHGLLDPRRRDRNHSAFVKLWPRGARC